MNKSIFCDNFVSKTFGLLMANINHVVVGVIINTVIRVDLKLQEYSGADCQ